MTTRRSDATPESSPNARWQRWIRDRASEHGSNFPPPGVNLDDRSGVLKNWLQVLNRNLQPGEKEVSPSTVRGWMSKPSPAACLRIAHALDMPETDVFAVAYGTDERAAELADKPAIDPTAQALNELLNNPRLTSDEADAVRDLVQGIIRLKRSSDGNGSTRAAG